MRRGLAAAVLAGCFHPTAAPDVPCSDHGLCPDGQHCDMTQSPPLCIVGDAAIAMGSDADVDAPVISCATMACPASEPVCDAATMTCRGCVADSECPFACHELTGECVDDAHIVYVAVTGDDMLGDGTQTSPCATVSHALTFAVGDRTFIAVGAGVYNDAVVIGTSVTISGPTKDADGATLKFASPGGTSSHVIQVTSTSTVVVEGLTLDGLAMSGDVFRVESSGAMTTAAHLHILHGNGSGVFLRGTAQILRCEIDDNSNQGINSAGGGSTLVARCNVHDNSGTGIHGQGDFHIDNTFVTGNGAPGLLLGQNTGGGETETVTFSTIANNGTTGTVSGIDCRNSVVTVDSSIVASNGATPQIASQCQVTYSLFSDATPVPGATNLINTDPLFVDAANDFHLKDQSPAIDKANPAATANVDFDGDHRPKGVGFDIGADEH